MSVTYMRAGFEPWDVGWQGDTQNAQAMEPLAEFTARNSTLRASKVSKSRPSLAKADQALH